MADTKKPLRILITASRGTGHVNACMGIGKLLVDRGHDVMFIHFPEHKSLAENQGIKFIDIFDYQGDEELDRAFVLPFNDLPKEEFDNNKKYLPKDVMHGGRGRGRGGGGRGGGPRGGGQGGPMNNGENVAIENAIKSIKPDAVLGDYRWPMPFMSSCPCPFIPVMSNGPIALYNGPPIGTGLSVFDSPEKWEEARNGNEMMKEMATRAREGKIRSWTQADYLGIYIYPEALDYKELGPVNKNWVRLDQSIRLPEVEDFEIPEKLKDKSGKLIYASMGTNASNNPALIKMLVDACAKSPHRFIFALGRNGDIIKLPDNVWGDTYVKQVNIIPKVDLVITHCGSNSLVESLYFGKPMVAIPIFDDQLDNGQRVVDLKLGAKINMIDFTDEKLVKVIDEVLNDREIHENVKKVSESMRKSTSTDKIPAYIEYVARNKKSPFE